MVTLSRRSSGRGLLLLESTSLKRKKVVFKVLILSDR